MTKQTAAPVEIAATVTGEDPRRPPLTELLVTLVATNHSDAPRWVLVPRTLGQGLDKGGVDTLEVFRFTGKDGSVDAGWFMGNAGCWALRLGPGVRVELRGLPVRHWRDDRGQPPALEVIAADALEIGGKPAEAWFPGGDPVVRAAATVSDGQLTGSVELAGGPEVPIRVSAVARVQVPPTPAGR